MAQREAGTLGGDHPRSETLDAARQLVERGLERLRVPGTHWIGDRPVQRVDGTGRPGLIPPTVGAYIGAAYWFTSSTSFANPAVTIGRIFSDTFVGIAPTSALPFIGAQLIGGAIGLAIATVLFPRTTTRTEP